MSLSQELKMHARFEGEAKDQPEGARFVTVSATRWMEIVAAVEKLEQFGTLAPERTVEGARLAVPVRIRAPEASAHRATVEAGGVALHHITHGLTLRMDAGEPTRMEVELVPGRDGLDAEVMALVDAKLIGLRVERSTLAPVAARLQDIAEGLERAGSPWAAELRTEIVALERLMTEADAALPGRPT